jgi:hypothetical protein
MPPQETTFGSLLRGSALSPDFSIPWIVHGQPVHTSEGVAMAGLIGYMLAIVITLGGYFAALNWLIRPPDPWQSSAKISASTAQHLAKKRLPVVKPAEAASSESTTPAEPDTRLASVETSAPLAASERETTGPVEPAIVRAQLPAVAPRAALETAHVARRDVSVTKTRPGNRKRVERSPNRKLELMVLRTYERSDGKRFTRLLPLNSARNDLRNAMAFQPDDPW